MAQDSNSELSKAKVSLKVAGPHVVTPAATPGAPEMGENNTKARKGAIFLAGVIGVYVVFLVVTGQMGEFLSALSRVDTGWVAWASFAFVLYFAFGVLAYAIAVYLDHDSPVGCLLYTSDAADE